MFEWGVFFVIYFRVECTTAPGKPLLRDMLQPTTTRAVSDRTREQDRKADAPDHTLTACQGDLRWSSPGLRLAQRAHGSGERGLLAHQRGHLLPAE